MLKLKELTKGNKSSGERMLFRTDEAKLAIATVDGSLEPDNCSCSCSCIRALGAEVDVSRK